MSGDLLVPGNVSLALPALFRPTADAGKRFVEFFTANIRNANTRKAYARAANRVRRRLVRTGCVFQAIVDGRFSRVVPGLTAHKVSR